MYINDTKNVCLLAMDGIKVLVAEDNPINLVIVKRFLTKWGIQITAAVNGREALEKFNQEKFDLLLLDLEMPEMDGSETLKEIRKTDKRVPVVAFTAAVYENIQSDLYSKGFTDFIHKPFRPEELHRKIYTLVMKKGA